MNKSKLAIVIVLAAGVLAAVVYSVLWQKSALTKTNANLNATNAGLANKNTNTNAPDEQKMSAHFRLKTPILGAEVGSPLEISGSAAGWYFEATFPIRLVDGNGNILASGQARATEDWMTENFVPFAAELSFSEPTTPTGMLIFKNDNPSGDPTRDEEVDVPVRFSLSSAAACRSTGCSGQICSDSDMITTCIYLPEYACYKKAKCERQSDGKCGWTQTPELTSCVNKSKE
jgi:Immunoglobulin-like domain of bacterial spore germination